jgi:hypothetical protein
MLSTATACTLQLKVAGLTFKGLRKSPSSCSSINLNKSHQNTASIAMIPSSSSNRSSSSSNIYLAKTTQSVAAASGMVKVTISAAVQ